VLDIKIQSALFDYPLGRWPEDWGPAIVGVCGSLRGMAFGKDLDGFFLHDRYPREWIRNLGAIIPQFAHHDVTLSPRCCVSRMIPLLAVYNNGDIST
jgi:hypothetical protein